MKILINNKKYFLGFASPNSSYFYLPSRSKAVMMVTIVKFQSIHVVQKLWQTHKVFLSPKVPMRLKGEDLIAFKFNFETKILNFF